MAHGRLGEDKTGLDRNDDRGVWVIADRMTQVPEMQAEERE